MKSGFVRIILVFLIGFGSTFAQSKIDSLNLLLKTATADTSKINLLCKLATIYAVKGSYEIALTKADETIEIATKEGSSQSIIKAGNTKGLIYYLKSDYVNAIPLFEKSLRLAQESGNENLQAETLVQLSNVYMWTPDYKKAVDYAKQSLKIYENKQNFSASVEPILNIARASDFMSNYEVALEQYIRAKRLVEQLGNNNDLSSILLGIGNIYIKKDPNNDKAIEFYKQALDVARKINQPEDEGQALNNLGNVYRTWKNYDEALNYFQQALELKDKNPNDKSGTINPLLNLGSTYLLKNDFKKAMEYYQRCLSISEEIGDKSGIIVSNLNVGILYNKQNNFDKGIEYLNKGIALARTVGLRNQIKSAYEELADVYTKEKQFEKALFYYREFSMLKDSLLNESNSNQLNSLQVKFETKEKEAQLKELDANNKVLQSKNQSQKIIIWAVIFGLLVVILSSFFLYRSYKATQRAKEIVFEQKKIVDGKNHEITDSINYAQKIQRAILPDIKIIQEQIPQIFILYKPKDIVSGDFYWFNSFTEHWLLAAADCTGHGVPGSLMSMIGSNLLSQITQTSTLVAHRKPSFILESLNDEIQNALHQRAEGTESKDGMDIALLRYTPSNKTLEYAGANRPIYHISSGVLTEYKADKRPIGGYQYSGKDKFKNNIIPLKPYDTVYLSTDGYADQFGGSEGKKVMTKRFKEVLLEIQSLSMPQQQAHLDTFIEKWKDGKEQIDDILVVGIRFL